MDVADYGIRGVHLAHELLEGRHRTLVLVDTIPMDEPPGTMAVLRADAGSEPGEARSMAISDRYGMEPHAVLRLLRSLGGSVQRVLVIGCRPTARVARTGLSEAVAAAVDEAVRLVTEVVRAEVGVPGSGAEGNRSARSSRRSCPIPRGWA